MGPKRKQNGVKIESQNEWMSVLAFSSFLDGFWKAKVVDFQLKSFPEDVWERKRRFPENVGFTIVKP